MRLLVLVTFCITLCLSNLAFGAATVFLKDGTRESGNSAWIEGGAVCLNTPSGLHEFPVDDVLMEETQRSSRIGKYADVTIMDAASVYDAGSPKSVLLEQLLKEMNFDQQIDQVAYQFKSGALSSSMNSEMQEIFNQALADFDPQKAKDKVRAHYRKHLDEKTLNALVAWSKTPLALKVKGLEKNKTEVTPEKLEQAVQDLEQNPLPAGRIKLLKELDKAGRVTEMTLKMVNDSLAGMMTVLPRKIAEDKQARAEFKKQMELQKAKLEPMLRTRIQASLVLTYKDLSDSELREYVAFLKTEPARKFTKATMVAMSELTRDLSRLLFKNVSRAVEQKMGQ